MVLPASQLDRLNGGVDEGEDKNYCRDDSTTHGVDLGLSVQIELWDFTAEVIYATHSVRDAPGRTCLSVTALALPICLKSHLKIY